LIGSHPKPSVSNSETVASVQVEEGKLILGDLTALTYQRDKKGRFAKDTLGLIPKLNR
jgi:hypothetical protein